MTLPGPAWRRPTGRGAAALSVLLGAAGMAAWLPQQRQVPVQVISGGATCECRLGRYVVATITDSLYEGGTSLNPLSLVSSTLSGGFFIAGSAHLWFADRTGHIVREVGRVGRGPGEYRSAQFVLEQRAGHRVYDQRLRRTTLLTRGSLAVAGTAPLPFFSFDAVLFSDGRSVQSGRHRAPGANGHPLHLIDAAGSVVRSFGGEERWLKAGRENPDSVIGEHHFQRALAPSGDSAIWVAHTNRYRIEKWDTAGRLIAIYERRSRNFPPIDRTVWEAGEHGGIIGVPKIRRLWEDPQGLLWVMTDVKRRERTKPMGQSEPEIYDTIIEVLDTGQRKVVAAGVINGLVFKMRGPLFYHSTYRESLKLEPLIDIWAFRPVPRGR
jgi:hypothetical protein